MWKEITVYIDLVRPNEVEKFFMGIGGFLGFWFNIAVGGIDKAIIWLAIMCCIDYVTGVLAAFKTGKWSSSVGFKGLWKKCFIFIVVSFCYGIDQTIHADMMRNMAIFAYATNEAGSVIENVDTLGFGGYIPKFLRNGLEGLKSKHEL